MANTVIRPSDTWVNADGLVVRFGRGAQVDAIVGAPWSQGEIQSLIADIDYKRLPTFQADDTTGVIYGDYPNAAIPSGVYFIDATLYVTTAFTGTSAALTLGLVTAAGVEVDNNGFFTSTNGAVTNLGAGAQMAGTGALLKATLGTTGYLWAAVTGASFTAGEGKLIVRYTQVDPVTHDYES